MEKAETVRADTGRKGWKEGLQLKRRRERERKREREKQGEEERETGSDF